MANAGKVVKGKEALRVVFFNFERGLSFRGLCFRGLSFRDIHFFQPYQQSLQAKSETSCLEQEDKGVRLMGRLFRG